MPRYEQIIFLEVDGVNGVQAQEAFGILDDDGETEAVEYLADWHNPGEHDTRDEPGRGTADEFFESDDGYIMSWNDGLGYIGLEFDTEFDLEPDDNPCEPEHHREYNAKE